MVDYKTPFEERINSVNSAENEFVSIFSNSKKLGFGIGDEFKGKQFYVLPAVIRKLPDFVLYDEFNNFDSIVEVKGFKGELKLKYEDLKYMAHWDMMTKGKLKVFGFDFSTTEKERNWDLIPFEVFDKVVMKGEHSHHRYEDSKCNCYVMRRWW